MDNIIDLKNINKIYGNKIKTQVLYDINIGFKNGSFNSIIGASGSGKSTLLNIIATLDRPTSGSININGVETTAMNKNQLAELRNQAIGFIFQFHYLLPEFTAIENVLLPYQIKEGKIPHKIKSRAGKTSPTKGLNRPRNHRRLTMVSGKGFKEGAVGVDSRSNTGLFCNILRLSLLLLLYNLAGKRSIDQLFEGFGRVSIVRHKLFCGQHRHDRLQSGL